MIKSGITKENKPFGDWIWGIIVVAQFQLIPEKIINYNAMSKH